MDEFELLINREVDSRKRTDPSRWGKEKIQRKFLENTKGYDLNSFVEMELKKGIKKLIEEGFNDAK